MKLKFGFGFNNGNLQAECDTFEEADEIIKYALNRGIITITTPDGAAVDLTAKKPEAETVEEKRAPAPERPAGKVIVGKTMADIERDAATVEDAQQAVKEYAAKHGVVAGRELLTKFGLKRTAEITIDKAAAIIGACNE
jgi:hypothetical protein